MLSKHLEVLRKHQQRLTSQIYAKQPSNKNSLTSGLMGANKQYKSADQEQESSRVSIMGPSYFKLREEIKNYREKANANANLQQKPTFQISNKKSSPFDVPPQTLQKYSTLKLASEALLHKLLRPRIYFDFCMTGLRLVRRAEVQLYTEACPELVLEFVRICKKGLKKRIVVNRLFRGLWLSCQLHIAGKHQINRNVIEFDKRALGHDHGGVLSFAYQEQESLADGILYFVITLKPLTILSESNLAFGQVINHHSILQCTKDFATGKSGTSIEVTEVGLAE